MQITFVKLLNSPPVPDLLSARSVGSLPTTGIVGDTRFINFYYHAVNFVLFSSYFFSILRISPYYGVTLFKIGEQQCILFLIATDWWDVWKQKKLLQRKWNPSFTPWLLKFLFANWSLVFFLSPYPFCSHNKFIIIINIVPMSIYLWQAKEGCSLRSMTAPRAGFNPWSISVCTVHAIGVSDRLRFKKF